MRACNDVFYTQKNVCNNTSGREKMFEGALREDKVFSENIVGVTCPPLPASAQ